MMVFGIFNVFKVKIFFKSFPELEPAADFVVFEF
jgi:hypothetical protein